MIKEVEMIKMRKDINYLQDEYGFTDSSLAKICGLAVRTVREFMSKKRYSQSNRYYRNLSDKNFHLIKKHLHIIKEQIKEAEKYQPRETK